MRKPSLDKLLGKIDPKSNIDYYYIKLDEILNTYRYPSYLLEENKDVQEVIYDFVHYASYRFRGRTPPSNATETEKMNHFDVFCDMYKTRIIKELFLDEIELHIARTEGTGGLYRFLQKIGQAMADSQIIIKVHRKICVFFLDDCNNDIDLIMSLCREYGKKFGYMLPPDWLERDCAHIRVFYREVFQYHPFIVKWLRDSGDLRCQSVSNIFSGKLKSFIIPQFN